MIKKSDYITIMKIEYNKYLKDYKYSVISFNDYYLNNINRYKIKDNYIFLI